MAELVQSVQDMLKEETWTRATISNYTQNNLKEFANIVEKAHSENCADEIYDICQEHLSHSKDSIIALYICGVLDLQKGSLDNSSLVTLVDIFKNNHKEPIVTYLCESILEDDPNNKFALRTLAEGYRAEGNEKYWDLYAHIVKIDFEEADLARLLAEHYEEAGDVDLTISYYKKAILRYINNSNYNAIKEVWSKLIQYIPQEIDFFQLLRRKISKQMGDIRTTTLMQELYNWYKDNAPSKKEYWDVAITILKQNLEVEPKDIWARKEIADCFRGKYKEHSHLEEYIRTSNLTQSYRNVFEAINDFEKHIAFDKGSYVFHRNWGVGRIRKLEGDTLTINFGRIVGIKEMKLSMAVTALKPLAKDHIWVLKATMQKEDLIKSVKADKAETLKIIIRSFDNNCDFKRIKAELVPSILTPGEWTSWNSAAKRILETDSSFGVNPNDISMYTVRDGNISPEEKISNEFKAQKQFFARADLLVKFFESDDTDNSSELFAEMYSYFTGYLKNISKVNEQVLASYLLVRSISAIDKQFAFPVKETFAEIYNRIEDPKEIYLLLKDSKSTHFKDDFIRCIKLLPNWNEEYVKLFPIVLKEELLNDLIKEGHVEDVQKLVRTSFEAFKDFRETVLFFFKECQDKDWFNEAGVSYEKQLITLINIIELTFREINNHVNSTENKKINKNATDLLFKTDAIFNYMFANGEDAVKKMYTLIDDISDIDPSYKALARNKILEKYPDFKFRVSEEKKQQSVGLIVTAKKLAEKKAEVDEIQNVLIPKNAAEVADAKAKGDLKENQEYKSAKEEQHFLNLKLTNLQNELNRAVVFDPTTSTTAIISFGTVVSLKDNQTGNEETYTILGPWESDPDNNVISYMAPFGDAILNKKVGDILQFTINEHKYDYTVKNISKAKDI
ncbi:MAG: transcription elongation factor GreA [Spirochaetia bacterium]|nr:transcription elongation factor GreA [Spirochaetia bacterium]